MAGFTKIIIALVLYGILVIMISYGCANQIPPGGGEVDKIPPEIVSVFPENGTVNFKEDYVEISFSEHVDKRSFQEAIFISPALDKPVDFDWGETSVELNFNETLRENTTYTITIGTDVIDLNNRNKLAEAFTFAFSTGSKIDNGIIQGKVFDDNPQGIMIFAYLANDTIPNPIVEKPNYVSQVGVKGNYTLRGLANGVYKIFAVRDDFRDLLYNPGNDYFGIQQNEILLSEKDSMIIGVNFLMAIDDTTSPHLSSATMTDRYHILLEYSEPVDSQRITNENYFIFDSTSGKRIDVSSFFKGKASNKQYFITVTDSLIGSDANYLQSVNVFDHSNNLTEFEEVFLDVNDKPDTLKPSIEIKQTEFAVNTVDLLKPWFILAYNDAVNLDAIKNSITISDESGKNYPYNFQILDDSKFKVEVNSKLKSAVQYSVIIDQTRLQDRAGNIADSSYTFKIITVNQLDFSGVSGTVEFHPNNSIGSTIVNLKNIDEKNQKYSQKLGETDAFNFDRVVPGKYLLWAYIDADSNAKYSFGKVHPFKYSEKFVYHTDTLNLRARWPVGDIKINFN